MKRFLSFSLGSLACFASSCTKNNLQNTAVPDLKAGDVATAYPSAAGDVVGKVTVGYQGWFSAPGDGSTLNSWQHQNLESWPDTREYTTTYAGSNFWQGGAGTPNFYGNLGNGQPAKMYSAYDQQVANTHCLWMQQNGIDCVALQRFGSVTAPGTLKDFHDSKDLKMMNAAQTYNRKFYIMYDCKSTDAIPADWTNTIVAAQHLTSSAAYARQNGKPVVAIWGIGKPGRGTAAEWLTMINWFKTQGCYVIGCPLANFATDTTNSSAYNACDMIMSWQVGRSSSTNFLNLYANDLAYCNAHNLDYQADLFPGAAGYNSSGVVTRKNEIPRKHGDFMWQQFVGAKNAGVSSIYISMFDEINEATAIYKCAEDVSMIPEGKYFLTLDADGTHVSSDFYLRLTNDGGKMIKGITPLVTTEPTPFVVATTIPNGTYKIINRNSNLALDAKAHGIVNGTPIQQWPYSGGANQKWVITSFGGGEYKIVGVESGKALNVTGNQTANGTALQLYDDNGASNERWTITPTSGGYYLVTGVQSGKPFEVAGNTATPGALINIYTEHNSFNQQWVFQAP